jgi:dTDP-4-dehydrorhamnose 3,5-epimerase
MRFEAIGESEARLVHLDVHRDERGCFARVWCLDGFRREGIRFEPVQANTSITWARGTLRGVHFQRAPKPDAKIVRCSHGSIYDVVVDLREASPTRGQWWSVELTGDLAIYVPAGFGHGFQTLTDHVVVEYLMDARYVPELYDGFRYDDPAIGIRWPLEIVQVSERDLDWTPLAPRAPWLPDHHASPP